MKYRRIDTTSKLFPYVESFWVLESRIVEKNYVDFKEYSFFANPFPHIVFQYLGKGFMNVSIHRNSIMIPPHHFYGQSSDPQTLATFGSFGLVGANFYPYAIPLLFDISSYQTTGQTLELQKLFGNKADETINCIVNADGNDQRICYLIEILEQRADNVVDRDPIIEAAIQFFLANDGRESIDSLCDHLGYSVRQIERSFKAKIGISPKRYARIIRFYRAISNYNKQKFDSLSQLALHSGFSDQAHFIREFKQFSGINPRHYFKELKAKLTFIKHN